MHYNDPPPATRFRETMHRLSTWIGRHWQQALAIGLVVFIILKKDVAIDLHLSGAPYGAESAALSDWLPAGPGHSSRSEAAAPMNTSQLTTPDARLTAIGEERKQKKRRRSAAERGIGDWSWLKKESAEKRAEKRRLQSRYVEQYAEIARREMSRHGIPASITLAQGLLESNSGQSRLAKQNKNHFGIKCFSKTCKKGHCRNFSDDHHKDFFRAYGSPEESYDAHSKLLLKDRYSDLLELPSNDYIGWAFGLKKAGYATDKHYAEKLIFLIEDLELYQYDF